MNFNTNHTNTSFEGTANVQEIIGAIEFNISDIE